MKLESTIKWTNAEFVDVFYKNTPIVTVSFEVKDLSVYEVALFDTNDFAKEENKQKMQLKYVNNLSR